MDSEISVLCSGQGIIREGAFANLGWHTLYYTHVTGIIDLFSMHGLAFIQRPPDGAWRASLGMPWIKVRPISGQCQIHHPITNPTFGQRLVSVGEILEKQYIAPMIDQCWASVYDAGPALTQHLVNVSCELGRWRGASLDIIKSTDHSAGKFCRAMPKLCMQPRLRLRKVNYKALSTRPFNFLWVCPILQ